MFTLHSHTFTKVQAVRLPSTPFGTSRSLQALRLPSTVFRTGRSLWNPTWDDAVWVGSADWLTTQSTFSIPGIQVFAELAAGGESGARSASGGPSTDDWAAIAFVVRGVDTGTPLDVAVTMAEGSIVGQPKPHQARRIRHRQPMEQQNPSQRRSQRPSPNQNQR